MPSYENISEDTYHKKGISSTWENSPRDSNGHLVLRPNKHTYRSWNCTRKVAPIWYPLYHGHPYCHIKWQDKLCWAQTPNFEDPQIYGTGAFQNQLANVAASRLYKEITDVKLGIGQIIAERQQTVNMIANRIGSIYRAYRSLRKGRNPFTGKKVNPRHAPDIWLEYNYGWVPFVSDVYDALELNSSSVPLVYVRKRASGTTTSNTKATENATCSYVWKTLKTETRITSQVTVGAKVRVANPTYGFLQQFDISNPLSLAWDLIPYSFVVDWFIPVGDWLRMQQALVGVQLLEPYTYHKSLINKNYFLEVRGDACRTPTVYVDLEANHEMVWKERTLNVPGIPPLEVDVRLDISKAISGLALMSQIFGRSRG